MTDLTAQSLTWSQLVANALAAKEAALLTPDGPLSGDELLQRASGLGEWLRAVTGPTLRAVPALVSDTTLGMTLVLAGTFSGTPIAPLGTRMTVPELAACVRGLASPVLLADPVHAELGRDVAWATGVQLISPPHPLPTGHVGPPPTDPQAIAYVLHTSGTTGAPKPVPYRQGALAARVRVYTACVPLGPRDVFVAAAGLHHIAGSGNLAVALAAGATVVSFPAFSVAAWRSLKAYGVTHALLIPSMIEMLLREDALALPDLRGVQYGGSPISPDTLRRMLERLPGVQLWQFFGQTEGSPLCALSPEDHRAAVTGRPELMRSVGRAAPETEIRLGEVGEDGVGEVHVRAPHLFLPAPDGWMATGDLARIDPDGYVFLAGRRGDTINRGGENVRPIEVETVLCEHPAIADAAVVGVPDRRLGEEVAAYVVPADLAAPPTETEIEAYVRHRLSGFKVPRVWHFVPDLPRNSQGKLLRRKLGGRSPNVQDPRERNR